MAQRVKAPRDLSDLSPAERQVLENAHARLKSAAAAYEPFVARRPDGAINPDVNFREMKRAQDDLAEAEADLWRLRKEILGWTRPSDAQRASEVVEWILEDEDN